MPDRLTPEALAAAVRARAGREAHVIGVDGFMESGKTTLAFELAELLGGMRIGLDSYVHTDRDESSGYAAALRLPYLRSHVSKLRVAFPFVVIDGICLLEAFAAIQGRVDTLIYVNRISKAGIWHDGFTIEDAVEGAPLPESWLHRSELTYHLAQRPHEKADFMYERTET